MRYPQILGVVFILLQGVIGSAVATEEEPLCAGLAELPVPATESDLEVEQSHCGSERFYFGMEGCTLEAGGPDYESARRQAYVERLTYSQSYYPYDGPGVLMMIYANGKGVPRDFELARKFACEMEPWTSNETSDRVMGLIDMQFKYESGQAVEDSDACKHLMLDFNWFQCVKIHDERFILPQRKNRLAAVQLHWSEEALSAFAELQVAAEQFFSWRSEEEIDRTGTARDLFSYEENKALEEELLVSLERFERGELPRASPDVLRASAALLEQRYARLLALAGNTEHPLGTINPAGIASTQASWQAYREAWVLFGGVRYPQVTEDAWREYFTHKRLAMLNELIRRAE